MKEPIIDRSWMIPGVVVIYRPNDGEQYLGEISEVKNIGRNKEYWTVRIHKLDKFYQSRYGRNTVSNACLGSIERYS